MKIFDHFNNILMSLTKEIGIIFLYFILNTFLILFKSDINPIYYTLKGILSDLIIIIIFLLIFKKIIIKKFQDFKLNYKKYLKSSFIYYILGLIISIITMNIITSVYIIPSNEIANESFIKIYPIYSIFNVLITAPIIEELMMRPILKDCFKNKAIYIILTGFIFAFLHIVSSLIDGNYYELFYLIPYGTLGCILSYIYLKTDNIWTNITFHSLHNFISLIWIFL